MSLYGSFCEAKTYAKLQIDISQTEGLVRVYIDGRTAKSTQLFTLIIYFSRIMANIEHYIPFDHQKSLA